MQNKRIHDIQDKTIRLLLRKKGRRGAKKDFMTLLKRAVGQEDNAQIK